LLLPVAIEAGICYEMKFPELQEESRLQNSFIINFLLAHCASEKCGKIPFMEASERTFPSATCLLAAARIQSINLSITQHK